MAPTVSEIVREHVIASQKLRKEIKGNPAKAKAFLIKAGILNKSGKLAKRYRPR